MSVLYSGGRNDVRCIILVPTVAVVRCSAGLRVNM
jgi:hypothetical protein